MRNHRESNNPTQENGAEKLKEVRIDARTTIIAQELQALIQELAHLRQSTTQEQTPEEHRIWTRIVKNKDFLASLHTDGFREILPEDSHELLRSEAKRLSLEISLKEAEFKRLQELPLTSNGMFIRSKDEPQSDIIVRKKESLTLIQTALLQREAESFSNKPENTPQIIDQTILHNAEDLDRRLSEFASRSSANEVYEDQDPELRKLITLRREIDGVASELDAASRKLERLQREHDDLNYLINIPPEERELLRQKNSADIQSLHTAILTLTKRLSSLVEEQEEEINRYLKKPKGDKQIVAN